MYGTTVQGAPNVVGYTYVIISGRDLLAGNYIYIADKAIDNWAELEGIEPFGAEAVVLMHEIVYEIPNELEKRYEKLKSNGIIKKINDFLNEYEILWNGLQYIRLVSCFMCYIGLYFIS